MAAKTADFTLEHLGVVERDVRRQIGANRRFVTGGAFRHLSCMIALKMTDETGRGRDGDMLPLHNLAVATGAAEFLPEPKLSKVRLMVKDNTLLEWDATLQQSRFVTPAAQAVFIVDLRPWLRSLVNAGRVIDQH